MNNNGFNSPPIRTYRKPNKPNPVRTALVLLMTAVIIAFVVVFIMSVTGTGMFADKKDSGDPKVSREEESSSETSQPEDSSSEKDPPVDPTVITYTFATKKSADIGMGDLLLINEEHLYKFTESGLLSDLYPAPSPHYSIARADLMLKYHVIDALNRMMADFYTAKSYAHFHITTAYRDFDTQNGLHDKNPNGAVIAGASDYHSGATIQFSGYDVANKKSVNISASEEAKWIKENAHKYGFVFRSPSDKKDIVGYTITWQLRYVGEAHAQYMYENNLCLEEYLTKLSSEFRYKEGGSNNLTVECQNGKTYQIYYVEGSTEVGAETKIPVPSNRNYTVSGDNIKGYIVTVLAEIPDAQD